MGHQLFRQILFKREEPITIAMALPDIPLLTPQA
jgi:hypothetical protein